MRFKVTVNTRDLSRSFMAGVFGDVARRQILGAMGTELIKIAEENIGKTGIDRPATWPPLSKPYAKRVKRDYATLYLTGALYRSSTLRVTPDVATVTYEDTKASLHQDGTEKMPRRPFLPFNSAGQLTPYARRRIENAANLALQSLIRKQTQLAIY